MITKVCGMRHPENITQLVILPIDWMGLIFYEKSPRNVKNGEAAAIIAASGEKVKRVGVFVNEAIDIVVQKVAAFKLSYVQLHGKESPEYCYDLLEKSAKTFGCVDDLKIIKAFSVDEAFDFEVTNAYAPYVEYFLFDTKGKNPGGNGFAFDWTLLKKYQGNVPFLLSGGLDEHSAEAIQSLNFSQLVGVDVNSKFEIEPTLKDIGKVRRFVGQLKLLTS
ncbi:MAG: phosphoribosylanthranilate isomerase [Bacteroidota bacterium]